MNRLLLIAFVLLANVSPARAFWALNGNPPCANTGAQQSPAMLSDGAGGAILAWQDQRNGTYDIYVSRIGPTGNTAWCVGLCVWAGDQVNPVIVSDGAGGAIVAWEDGRNGGVDIFARGITAAGGSKWVGGGIPLCEGTGAHAHPAITTDGAGGAIVTWDDTRTGTADIYAARIENGGKTPWTLNGVALCTATNIQSFPAIASDGFGGAIVTWTDHRLGTLQLDIYARHIDDEGKLQWTANGVGVCTAGGSQNSPTIVSDGANGAIIAWQDRRTFHDDIWAQRINISGTLLWAPNGVALCNALTDQNTPTAISDGAGGAIVAWRDPRAGTYDIYARRVTAGGSVQWTVDGVALCTETGNQTNPRMTTDGAGGAIVAWQDERGANADIYARRVDAAGNLLWMAGGSEVCKAGGPQLLPAIVSGGAGDAMLAWSDMRIPTAQVYALRMSVAGSWGNPEPVITSIVDVPGDQGKSVTIRWSDLDRPGEEYIYEVVRNDFGSWTTVAWVYDQGTDMYSATVPTLDDSTCWSPFGHDFKVRGYISSIEESNIVLGRSVDNIAPPAPVLSVQQVGGTVTLTWTKSPASDFLLYSVYLSAIPGQQGCCYFDNAYDTTYTAAFGPPFADQYWSVVALDIHCNQSAFSNQAAFLLPNTPVGTNVNVLPYDENGSGTRPVGITFANVTGAGRTSLSVAPSGPGLPGSFLLGDSKYYNVSTTASFAGAIEVCIHYNEATLQVPEANLRMLHYDTALVPPAWVDITSLLDTNGDVICGVTNHLSPFIIGTGNVTAVDDDAAPQTFALHPNVPNPFNPVTTITYDVPPGGGDVSVRIYDVAGRLVSNLVDGHRPAGRWSVQWNGTHERGGRVASGVYFARMTAPGFVETRKLILLK